MNLTDLPHGRSTTFAVVPLQDDPQPPVPLRAPLRLIDAGQDDLAVLASGEDTWPVRGLTDPDARELQRVLARGRPRVVWATPLKEAEGQGGALLVQVQELVWERLLPSPVAFGVDEELVETLRRSKTIGAKTTAAGLVDRLTEWFLLPSPEGLPSVMAIATSGQADSSGAADQLSLHGRTHSAEISRGADDVLRVTRVTRLRRAAGGERDPWCLLQGTLSFVDVTLDGAQRAAAVAELDALIGGAGSYLTRWTEYNTIERRRVVDRARRAGSVRYDRCLPLADGGWRFRIPKGVGAREIRRLGGHDSDDLAAVASIPPVLEPDAPYTDPDERPHQEFTGQVVGMDLNERTIDLRSDRDVWDGRRPPAAGHLILSLAGDEIRLRRREQARDAIITTRPRLGLLLEGQRVSIARHRVHERIPPRVLAHFPGGKPTDRQLDALRVAMNTPDLAVIQGPPGTGKTDVIAALEIWLAEEAKDELAGSVLLTSYQHDAVDNAAARSTVLDLPALRVGSRRAPDDPGEDARRWIEALRQALMAEIAARAGGRLVQEAHEIRDRRLMYMSSPTPPEQTAALLELVARTGLDVLSSRLRDQLHARAAKLRDRSAASSLSDDDLARLENAARSLRTSATAFSDDGPRNAHRVLSCLRDAGLEAPSGDAETLARAAELDPEQPLDEAALEVIDAIPGIRDRLLDQVLERARHVTPVEPVHDAESRLLLTAAAREANDAVRRSPDGVSEVLADLHDSLVNDPRGIRQTLSNYTAVLAATCQQSVSRAMAAERDADAWFETVIVDEAARANPLDLMIPLAQAERRIVLVGDQRQLPHVLEPEIERELDGDVAEATRVALRQSLFERLYVDLSDRHMTLGEPRRVVTLDTQFRMHPVLGDFVSRAFYAPHGTPLRSGRPATDFPVRLDETGDAVAAWVDVPFAVGGEQAGTSKSRKPEADWIAGHLVSMMERAPTLSFGVISFYSAQVRMIQEALADVDVTVRTDAGGYEIAPHWQTTTDDRGRSTARLRIGTVDAFQGREFDVVLLSLTRSSRPAGSTEPEVLRGRFGHLMLENRLCVAMSRQRRLLVAIGDAEQFAGDEGSVAVPSLRTFMDVCDREHGARISA